MDVSDFDGDDNDVHDDVPPSPRPPSHPRPPSQAGPQDTRTQRPQVALMGCRMQARSSASQQNAVNVVCSTAMLFVVSQHG